MLCLRVRHSTEPYFSTRAGRGGTPGAAALPPHPGTHSDRQHRGIPPIRRERLRTTPVFRASKLILPGEQDHRRGAS